MKKTIVAVAGPTASGKSALALHLAEALEGEIVSCDSMQLYRGMDIGSAKPTEEERRRVPHHLVDCIDPGEDFSVARYQELALAAIDDILERGRLPVIAGGTGLYLNAILYEMDFGPGPGDEDYRRELEALAAAEGSDVLHQRLAQLDPAAAERIHPHNTKRLIRALEAAEREERPLEDFSAVAGRREEFSPLLIGLDWEREALYRRIDRRVDRLFAAGLEEEVRGLMDRGFCSRDTAMKGIGYKEVIDYLNGDYERDEAIRLVKRNTRHYAKRQLTWFRRYKDMQWFPISEEDAPEKIWKDITEWVEKRS